MTSLANNPKFQDIVIDFTITHPDGALHHRGSYHLSNDIERRAVAERLHNCLAQGFTVTTKRGEARKRLYHGEVTSMADPLLRAINDHSKRKRA